jgi:hypothetical protein
MRRIGFRHVEEGERAFVETRGWNGSGKDPDRTGERAVEREVKARPPGRRGVRQMPTAFLTTIFLFPVGYHGLLVRKNAWHALEAEQHALWTPQA